jgi:hypothetical protein
MNIDAPTIANAIIAGTPNIINDLILDLHSRPRARKEVIAWAESTFDDAHKIDAMFGDIPESGIKTGALLLQLPIALKTRMENAAGDAEQSLNAGAMRCIERCISLTR